MRNKKGQFIKGIYYGYGFKKGHSGIPKKEPRYCSCGKIIKSKESKGCHSCSAKNKQGIPYWLGKKMPEYICKQFSERAKKRIGNSNPCWRGGRTSLWQLIRGLPESDKWRKQVFEKDGYICKKCGYEKGGILNAHHIKPFQKILNEFLQQYNQFSPIEDKETLVRLAITYQPFWNISNGITMCKGCHNDIKINCHIG